MAKKNSMLDTVVAASGTTFAASTAVYTASDIALKNRMPRKMKKNVMKVHSTSGMVMVGSAIVSTVGTIMMPASTNIDYSELD